MMVWWRKLTFRQQIYAAAGATVLILVVLGGIHYWLIMGITNTTSQIRQLREMIVRRSRAIEYETTLKREAPRAEREMGFLDNILPAPERLVSFSNDLSLWASQNRVEYRFSFAAEKSGTETEPGSVPFSLAATGPGVSNLLGLLRAMETSRYFIKFDGYNITSEGSTYSMTVDGQVFTR